MRTRKAFLLTCLALSVAASASAQTATPGLTLSFRRDFGFSSGGRIQGAFTLTASGPQDLKQVEFLFDGKVVSTATRAPFQYRFNTSTYPLGQHMIEAVGTLAEGTQIRSVARQVEFVSPEVGWQTVGRFVLPLLAIVLVVGLLGTAGPLLLGRRAGVFELGAYGVEGGAVCSRCGLPFARHFLSPRVWTARVERCPHCGHWQMARRATSAQLEAAERRYLAETQRGALPPQQGEHLREEIDDSRYEDE
jgi:predicted RNA-binding Zn-ribbon protein involved in translation (DUF1610 family)